MFVTGQRLIQDRSFFLETEMRDLHRVEHWIDKTAYFEQLILWKKRYTRKNLQGEEFDWSKTLIKVKKATPADLMQEAFRMTNADKEGTFNVPIKDAVRMEHSPLRTLWFCIRLYHIPNYLHVHLRTHNKFAVHTVKDDFVQTGREERSIRTDEGRWDSKNHAMFINAQDLIKLSGVRLCEKADHNLMFVQSCIIAAISKIAPEIAEACVPKCVARNGLCNEQHLSCKQELVKIKKYYQYLQGFSRYRENECESLKKNK
jgi:hypothetical protein